MLNRELGIGVVDDTGLSSVVAFTFDGARITRIDMVRSPRKLPAGARWVR